MLPTPDLPLAAMTILQNQCSLAFMIPFGIVSARCWGWRCWLGLPPCLWLCQCGDAACARRTPPEEGAPGCPRPCSQSFAVSTRVGNQLGAAQPRGAKLTAEVGTALSMGLCTAIAAALLLSGGAAALFTSDPAVLELCRHLLLPLAIVLLSEPAGGQPAAALAHGGAARAHLPGLTPPPTPALAQPTAGRRCSAARCAAAASRSGG